MSMAHMASPILDRELKKGSAELLILSLVEDRPRHGYDIGQLIELRSRGTLRFNVASLYPLLYRLEKRRRVRRPRAGEGGKPPPPLLPAHTRGRKNSGGPTRRLARVRGSDQPHHR